MAEAVKYVSLDNLIKYDELIKNYILTHLSLVDAKASAAIKAVALNNNKLQFFTDTASTTPIYEIDFPQDTSSQVNQLIADVQQLQNDYAALSGSIDAAAETANEASALANAALNVTTVLIADENTKGSIKKQIADAIAAIEPFDPTELLSKIGTVENKIGNLGTAATVADAIADSKAATLEEVNTNIASQISSALSSVLTYKGIKNSVREVEAITEAKVGDVWLVAEDNSEYIYSKEGNNAGYWEKFGTAVNLANYATNQSVTDAVAAESSRATEIEQSLSDRTTALENKSWATVEALSEDDINAVFEPSTT